MTVGLILIGFLFLITPALAAEGNAFLSAIGISGGRLIPSKCTDTGASSGNVNDCGLNEIMQTVVNFTQLLLGLAGSLALLAFLYGGVLWILSAGKPEMIEKGKQAITAAVVGLVIMLTSWLIVNTTIAALTKGQVGATAQIFNQNWFQTQQIESPGSGATQSQSNSQTPSENTQSNPNTAVAPNIEAQPTPQADETREEHRCSFSYTDKEITYSEAQSLCQSSCAESCPDCTCNVLMVGGQNEAGEAVSTNFSCTCSNLFTE